MHDDVSVFTPPQLAKHVEVPVQSDQVGLCVVSAVVLQPSFEHIVTFVRVDEPLAPGTKFKLYFLPIGSNRIV